MSAVGLTRLDLVANIRFPGPRASGIQVAAMAEALAATGLTVEVVVPRRYPYRPADVFRHYGVRETFRVHRIANLDTIDMVRPEWQRVPFLAQSLTFAWRALARSAIERDAGVLVRDHYTLDVLVGGLRDRDRLRVACEVHDLPKRPGRQERLARALTRIPAVLAISDALRDDLVGLGVDAERIRVERDGVDLRRFRDLPDAPTARRALGIPVDVPTVVYAGQLFPWKGVDTLVAAMGRLPEAQLLVVGGLHDDLVRLQGVAGSHAPNRVVFTGFVPPPDVPFYLSAGDVLCLPNSAAETISARYTSPLKLFEAMASGRPIVASDLPSLGEVLGHDRNAILVAPDDPAALAAGIDAVLGSPALAARLAGAAREEVAGYDWAARAERVARFLRDRLTIGTAA